MANRANDLLGLAGMRKHFPANVSQRTATPEHASEQPSVGRAISQIATGHSMTRVLALLVAWVSLTSCSTMAEKVIDGTPKWMGGLPKDAPPRHGTPEYEEFQRKREVEWARDKSHDAKPEQCKDAKASVVEHVVDHCSTDDHADPLKGH